MEFVHQFLLKDGKIIPNIPLEQNGEVIIYEVLRIIDGIALFLESHLQRLFSSAYLLGKNIDNSDTEFAESINKLILSNQITSGNVKISLEYNAGSKIKSSIIGFIPHKYPTEEDYCSGVRTISNICQRINPRAKAQNAEMRKKLNDLMETENAYEVVLVHPDGYITECSRSNIFFIKGEDIITAPDEEVLAGITRNNIIQLCRENGFNIRLQHLNYDDLSKIEGAFITGTSPKVLPIKSLDSFCFALPNKMVKIISHKYDELISSYLIAHQQKA